MHLASLIDRFDEERDLLGDDRPVPIFTDQATWLFEQGCALGGGIALDVGFGCGFSAATLAAAGLDVVCITDEAASSPRRHRGEQLCADVSRRSPRVIQGYSDIVMAQLAAEEREFDFIFVDAGHRLDDVFVEAHFAGRLVKTGGILALDDTHFASVRTVANWINRNLRHRWIPIEPLPKNTVAWRRTLSPFDDRTQADHRADEGEPRPFTVAQGNHRRFQTAPDLDHQ